VVEKVEKTVVQANKLVRVWGRGLPLIVAAGVSQDAPGTVYPLHRADHLEIDLISAGRIDARLNGEPQVLESPHAYGYFPGDEIDGRAARDRGALICRWVKFEWPGAEKAGTPGSLLPRKTALLAHELRECMAAFDVMLERHVAGDEGSHLAASGALIGLMGLLARALPRTSTAQPAQDRRMANALAFIEQNYRRPLTVAEIARVTRLSADYFSRMFREHTGASPVEHLMNTRLRVARTMLLSKPELTVQEIARLCGFNDAKYFMTAFRTQHGVSPGRYRRQTGWRKSGT
jgi:AraC-like DNA-binding protein